MKRPVIGLTCSYDYSDIFTEQIDRGLTVPMWNYISEAYIRCIERAGGFPLLIANLENEDELAQAVDLCDGFLFTGGNDIDPLCYGQVDQGACGRIIPQRDRQETELVRYVLEKTGKSVFGICRGCQLINVALGGTLIQDLSKVRHFKSNYSLNTVSHYVEISEGTSLASILGPGRIGVNSLHHQAADVLGSGLRASAYSEDGVVEAVELESSERFFLAVQWHPEKLFLDDAMQGLFRAFVDSCRS